MYSSLCLEEIAARAPIRTCEREPLPEQAISVNYLELHLQLKTCVSEFLVAEAFQMSHLKYNRIKERSETKIRLSIVLQ